MRARAFRAWLEPLIPSLRRARRDTGFPAAVSLLAIRRAWLISARVGVRVLPAVPWTTLGTVLVLEGVTHPSAPKAWVWAPVPVHEDCHLRLQTPYDDQVGTEGTSAPGRR